MAVTDPGPLDWRVSIVDKSGRPSPEFQRRWNQNRDNTAQIVSGGIAFGNGPPVGAAQEGAEYINVLTNPYTLYVGHSGNWHTTSPIAANPSAIAKDTAVSGSATTYMRSDAAPAVQLGSDVLFGLVKVDGVTITAVNGVISGSAASTNWLPLNSGGDVALLVTDGAGNLVTVPYTP